jgi:diguanylate cyclase (GGDEF)-like protein/PAS domain S-box-containing protein
MSVRIKTLIVLCLTFLTMLGILYFTAQWFLLRDAIVTEQKSTTQDVTRLLAALDDQIAVMDETVSDWAPWDDTYAFISSGDTGYIDSNLPNNQAFTNIRVELMLFINNSGQTVFGKMVDLDSGAEIPIPESLSSQLKVGSRLLSHKDPSDKISGIISLPEGPLIIASQPILTSQGEGPIRGTLIMGRRLDKAEISRLSQSTQLSINVFPLSAVLPEDVALARKSLVGGKPIFVTPQNATVVSGYTLVSDIYGNPALILQVVDPREAFIQAQTSVRTLGLALLAIGIVLGLATMLILDRMVIRRLTTLSSSVLKVGSQGPASSRVEANGNDEIFVLATSVNSMLDSLENSHAKERENEEKFRNLFNNAEVGIFRTRLDGSEILDMNERFLMIFGRTRAEMQGSASVLHWADPREREEMVRRLEAEDRVIDFECGMLDKQGQVRRCLTSIRLYREQGILEGSILDITERKQAEEALQQSEFMFRALFEASPDAVMLIDPHDPNVSWPIIDCNAVACVMNGYDRDELIGHSIDIVNVAPGSQAERIAYMKRLREAGNLKLETFHRHKNGTIFPIEVSTTLVQVGERELLMGIDRDTTKSKQVEAALRQSEAELRALFASMHDVVLVIDRAGVYREIAPTNPELLVIPPEELLGKNVRDFFPFEQAETFTRVMQQVLDTKQTAQIEYDLIIGDRTMWFDASISPMTEDSTLWVAHDITERKQAEVSLRESEEKFHNLFNNAEVGMFSTRLDGSEILDVNERLLTIFGRTRAEMQGSASVLHWADPREREEMVRQLETEDHVKDFECGMLNKQGQVRRCLVSSRLYREQGILDGSILDITERKQAEETLTRTEQRYRQAITRAGGVPYQLDYGSESYVFLGEGFESLTGYLPSEMTGPLFTSRLRQVESFGEYKGLSHEQYIIRARQGKVDEWREDLLFERKDGKLVWLADQSVQIKDADGKTIGALGILMDITERKQVEAALRQSEAELRALFASMHDAVLVIDRTGVYREIAPTNPELLVMPPEEMLGKNVRDFFPFEKAETFTRVMQQVLDTKQTAQIEYDVIIGDRTMWFEASISPMTEDSTLWVAHDITQRKRFELVQNAIYRITQAAISNEGSEALYRSIHSILGELIPAENFFIALYDPASKLISFPYYIDQYDEAPSAPTPVQGLTGYVIRTGLPLLINRENFDRLVGQGEVEAVGTAFVDWMGAPLKTAGRIIGVMAVQSYTEGIHFDQEDLNLFEFVSTQVAQAIERKRMEQEIQNLSLTDEMTGLYNRRGFTLLAEQEMKLARRAKRSMLLFFGDVDDLKVINDTHGHAQGDLALKEISAILRETFRETDIPARFGGDEFVILAVDASMESAEIITSRIRAALKRRNQQGDQPYQLSLSLGIARYDPEAPCTVSELIAQADEGMYDRKKAGKGKQ